MSTAASSSSNTCSETFPDNGSQHHGASIKNKYVIVFQDFLTKWPMVFLAPDQKTARITCLLAEEIVPLFGVPDALLSYQGTNLLSHLMQDVRKLVVVTKLNTTAYHPQCDGMVERLNCTLKSMLRKQDLCQIWSTVGWLSVWCAMGLLKHTPRIHQGEAIISTLRD